MTDPRLLSDAELEAIRADPTSQWPRIRRLLDHIAALTERNAARDQFVADASGAVAFSERRVTPEMIKQAGDFSRHHAAQS